MAKATNGTARNPEDLPEAGERWHAEARQLWHDLAFCHPQCLHDAIGRDLMVMACGAKSDLTELEEDYVRRRARGGSVTTISKQGVPYVDPALGQASILRNAQNRFLASIAMRAADLEKMNSTRGQRNRPPQIAGPSSRMLSGPTQEVEEDPLLFGRRYDS